MFRLFGEEPFSFEPDLSFIDARSNQSDALAVRTFLNRPLLISNLTFIPEGSDERTASGEQ